MLSRAIPAVIAGPISGVLLDRFDRRRIMIASDLVRSVVALAFILSVNNHGPWLLYLLSALLMFASPVLYQRPGRDPAENCRRGRSAHRQFAHADHAVGYFDVGHAARRFEHGAAGVRMGVRAQRSVVPVFGGGSVAGALRRRRFPRSAGRRSRRHRSGRGASTKKRWPTCARVPLVMGIGLISVGWAMGGGAAQILFALFGEQVFHARRRGNRYDLGLCRHRPADRRSGGALGGGRLGFSGYKRAVTVSYLLHGAAYVAFSKAGGVPGGASAGVAFAGRDGRDDRPQQLSVAAARRRTSIWAGFSRRWNHCGGSRC